VHLIELELKSEGHGKSVEVYVDSEQGVTTEICSTVSREMDRLVESAGLVRGSYRLTVSSPGIARPLKYAWQYKKHKGRQLEVKVRSAEGLRNVAGTLESADDKMIVLATGKGSEPEAIAFEMIVEAHVRAPW
jgi:ribosome maturation factor RimP